MELWHCINKTMYEQNSTNDRLFLRYYDIILMQLYTKRSRTAQLRVVRLLYCLLLVIACLYLLLLTTAYRLLHRTESVTRQSPLRIPDGRQGCHFRRRVPASSQCRGCRAGFPLQSASRPHSGGISLMDEHRIPDRSPFR